VCGILFCSNYIYVYIYHDALDRLGMNIDYILFLEKGKGCDLSRFGSIYL
jgi:hypothetical protein